MRLSTKKGDPGYHPMASGTAEVYLDGKKLENCFTADEEKGTVGVYTEDGGEQELAGEVKMEILDHFALMLIKKDFAKKKADYLRCYLCGTVSSRRQYIDKDFHCRDCNAASFFLKDEDLYTESAKPAPPLSPRTSTRWDDSETDVIGDILRAKELIEEEALGPIPVFTPLDLDLDFAGQAIRGPLGEIRLLTEESWLKRLWRKIKEVIH